MYSVPSTSQRPPATAQKTLTTTDYLTWFALTALLALLSVFLSDQLHVALQMEPRVPHLAPDEGTSPVGHQLIDPLIFDKHSSSFTFLAWGIFPGVLISAVQSFFLVSLGLMNLRAPGFILCCALLWGAFVGVYLSIYPEPGLSAERPNFGAITLIAGCFISAVALLISAVQSWAMSSAAATRLWLLSNTLGYSIGWSLGMYVLSRTYSVEHLGCISPDGRCL